MSQQRLPFAAAALVLLLVPALRGTPVEPAQSASPRIVAIGDIHGALNELAQVLHAAGLIDARRRWSGGATRLVQTGDFTDRGADVRGVMDLLMRLEGEARRAGGRVEVLLGNHEGMNILHDFRDVSPNAYAAFADRRSENRRRRAFEAHASIAKRRGLALDEQEWMAAHPLGYVEYVDAMGPSGHYGRWIRERKATVLINETIFMHAGLNPQSNAPLEEVNKGIEREIQEWDDLVKALHTQKLVDPTFSLQEIVDAGQVEIGRIVTAQKAGEPLGDHVTQQFVGHLKLISAIPTWGLIDAEGPMWYRGLATLPETELPAIDALLKRYGARRFVTGHTPQMSGGRINSRFAGRVWLIDTGMLVEHFKGGQPSALELQDGRATAIYVSGREVLDGGTD